MSLLFPILIPIFAITAIFFKAPPRQTALIASLLNFSYCIGLFLTFKTDVPGYQQELDYLWMQIPLLPLIHFHLGLDGFNLPMVILSATITLAAVGVAPESCKRPREFFICLMLISLGAIGAFLSLDLFFFYIFHEFALIPTFLLIGFWGGQNRIFAGMQITLYLILGSLILLAGILALVLAMPADIRTFNLPDITAWFSLHHPDVHFQHHVFLLFILGFGILISLFPFHSWAPTGYAAAPPPAAMLHAGVLKKFGLYGLLRVAIPLLPAGFHHWLPWILVLLSCNVIYIGLVTIAQKELPLLLGFSSVMHMGYLFLGLASWNIIGWTGVIILMVAHGLSISLLFGLAGEIQQRAGENRLEQLGGLAKQAPFLCAAFMIGSMAAIGVPGLANFAGEILIFLGAWNSFHLFTMFALWGLVLSAVYQLRAVARIFFGPVPANLQDFSDLKGFRERAPYVLLIAILFIIGFAPNTIAEVVHQGMLAATSLALN